MIFNYKIINNHCLRSNACGCCLKDVYDFCQVQHQWVVDLMYIDEETFYNSLIKHYSIDLSVVKL